MSATIPAAPRDTPDAIGAPPGAADAEQDRASGLWRDTFGNIRRQRSAVIGAIILTLLVLMAVFAPLIATHDPTLTLLDIEDNVAKRSGPCIHLLGCDASRPQHIFGTDGNFRDVYSRVVYGARTSLFVGFVAVGFAIIVGTLIGAVAGYYAGADNFLMRIMDVLLAFPSLLLAILIVTALGQGLQNALLAIGIVTIPIYARIVRSSVLSTRENDFVTASRALGESAPGILMRRILPNSVTPLIVAATLGIGTAVLEIAALAFIGVTGTLDQPEWGSMIAFERNQLFLAPHIILVPGIAITLTVLGFNLLGDGLRDALDPRLNR